MTKLSVNINKLATLRNSRGGNNPDLIQCAIDAQRFGADGITVHPRPDERHIRYQDVRDLRGIVTTEFNIEGNCHQHKFIDLVLDTKPEQVTLVPDSEGQLTSDHGWDTIRNSICLTEVIALFKNAGIRVSLFIDPDVEMIKGAAAAGTDRVELYTESYARAFPTAFRNKVLQQFVTASQEANMHGLGINAGHDLDLHNLKHFRQSIPFLNEVSIGHALICDSIYLGFENTIQLYKRQLL